MFIFLHLYKTYPLKKLIFALFLINSLCLFTQTNSFVKEYTYKAGEADSKLSSKTLALKEVKTAAAMVSYIIGML